MRKDLNARDSQEVSDNPTLAPPGRARPAAAAALICFVSAPKWTSPTWGMIPFEVVPMIPSNLWQCMCLC